MKRIAFTPEPDLALPVVKKTTPKQPEVHQADLTGIVLHQKSRNYVVNPAYVQARIESQNREARLKRSAKVTSKWEVCNHPEDLDMIGNVRPNWDVARKAFTFREATTSELITNKVLGAVISSALLLYRLLVLFSVPVRVVSMDKYKTVWWTTLRHKESGEFLDFGEWKGGAGTWTRFHETKELPASYKRDTLELLNELCSQDCPHPYDGLIAGSVA